MDIERVINTRADATTRTTRDRSRRSRDATTITVSTPQGDIEIKRPSIIRSQRLNRTVLTREEVEAFARLEARSRELRDAS